jgi:hypothetical protein
MSGKVSSYMFMFVFFSSAISLGRKIVLLAMEAETVVQLEDSIHMNVNEISCEGMERSHDSISTTSGIEAILPNLMFG